MTWHKYFAIGGREIGNAARAIGIQDTADCPVRWIVDRDDCETLADALGDATYSVYNIDTAPWYDTDNPERSARILGLYPIEITGLENDTREVGVEEKITDGGHIGRLRRGSRRVSVRALLVTEGRDALEAGMTWLRSALDARDCSLHNSHCGLADFEYFVDCPPSRGSAQPTWSGVIVTNRAINPSFEGATLPAGATVSTVWSRGSGRSLYIAPEGQAAGYGHEPYGHTPYGH